MASAKTLGVHERINIHRLIEGLKNKNGGPQKVKGLVGRGPVRQEEVMR